jgi:SAM-dependent methyltransferase
MTNRRDHWRAVYANRDATEVSWYQENPARSLILIEATGVDDAAPIIDIGGGSSRLVDRLLAVGFTNLTVLDLAELALRNARERIGEGAGAVTWLVGDVLTHVFERPYEVWHDRATFHFLIETAEEARYMEQAASAVLPGGHLIIAGFGPDGPERCSGLPVRRHDADSLIACFDAAFEPVEFQEEAHHTPAGEIQHFLYGRFRRRR